MEVNINNVNVVELVNLDISLMAIEDKIIVLHDNYKSGYECEDCNETGFVTCTSCDGSGLNRFDSNCTTCEGKKQLVCPVCKGQKLIIEIPQSARTLPTTGVVVSMGPECHAMKITKEVIAIIIVQVICVTSAFAQGAPPLCSSLLILLGGIATIFLSVWQATRSNKEIETLNKRLEFGRTEIVAKLEGLSAKIDINEARKFIQALRAECKQNVPPQSRKGVFTSKIKETWGFQGPAALLALNLINANEIE